MSALGLRERVDAMLRESVEHLKSASVAERRVRELHVAALVLHRELAAWDRAPGPASGLDELARKVGEHLAEVRALRSK